MCNKPIQKAGENGFRRFLDTGDTFSAKKLIKVF